MGWNQWPHCPSPCPQRPLAPAASLAQALLCVQPLHVLAQGLQQAKPRLQSSLAWAGCSQGQSCAGCRERGGQVLLGRVKVSTPFFLAGEMFHHSGFRIKCHPAGVQIASHPQTVHGLFVGKIAHPVVIPCVYGQEMLEFTRGQPHS